MVVSSLKYFLTTLDYSCNNLGMVLPRQRCCFLYQKRAHREIYLLSYIFIEQSNQNQWRSKVEITNFYLFILNALVKPSTTLRVRSSGSAFFRNSENKGMQKLRRTC